MKQISVISLLLTTLFAQAQPGKKQPQQSPLVKLSDAALVQANFRAMYGNAIMLQDLPTAIQAAHYLVASGQNQYGDSLAILYYSANMPNQAYLLAMQGLQANSNNAAMLQILADCAGALGKPKEAIVYQDKLYSVQRTVANGFKLMEMQLGLGRLAEGIETGDGLLRMKIDSGMAYQYADTSRKPATTPLKAAILNYMGVAAKGLGQKEKAKHYFREALVIDPKFLLAKMNLSVVEKEG